MKVFKKELRQVYRNILEHLQVEEREEANRLIFKHVTNLPEFLEASAFMTFLSFGVEVDTLSIARHALKCGKKLCVPFVNRELKTMNLALIHDMEQGLSPNPWGILEPKEGFYQEVPPDFPHLLLVPALAFDKAGYRLGRGGGYFDGFLPCIREDALTVGLGFHCQMAESLPHDPWDVPVKAILTEQGLQRVHETSCRGHNLFSECEN